jgi:hypothetical protein
VAMSAWLAASFPTHGDETVMDGPPRHGAEQGGKHGDA